MTTPPALTFMHLFPADAACAGADAAPVWFRDLVRGRAADRDGGPRVSLEWGGVEKGPQPADAGYVAINCRGLSDEKLRACGFRYVQQLYHACVLPDLSAVRQHPNACTPAVRYTSY